MIDLYSSCFGCGKTFESGDERLRFTMTEFENYKGLDHCVLSDDIDIGLCADCIEPGDFKNPERVP